MRTLVSGDAPLAAQVGEWLGKMSMTTVVSINLIDFVNLGSINGALTAILTTVSIIYVALKARNEYKVSKKNKGRN